VFDAGCIPVLANVLLEMRTMKDHQASHDLRAIAHQAMLDRGLEPDLPAEALRELQAIAGAARVAETVEGKLTDGHEWIDVVDQIRVQLASLNVERGFIDVVRSHSMSRGTFEH
jgi:hypothetical protein